MAGTEALSAGERFLQAPRRCRRWPPHDRGHQHAEHDGHDDQLDDRQQPAPEPDRVAQAARPAKGRTVGRAGPLRPPGAGVGRTRGTVKSGPGAARWLSTAVGAPAGHHAAGARSSRRLSQPGRWRAGGPHGQAGRHRETQAQARREPAAAGGRRDMRAAWGREASGPGVPAGPPERRRVGRLVGGGGRRSAGPGSARRLGQAGPSTGDIGTEWTGGAAAASPPSVLSWSNSVAEAGWMAGRSSPVMSRPPARAAPSGWAHGRLSPFQGRALVRTGPRNQGRSTAT